MLRMATTRAVEAARQQSQVLHPASSVPQDDCEPRSQLMWRIVGEMSSVQWKDAHAAGRTHKQLDPNSTSKPGDAARTSDASGSTIVPLGESESAHSSPAEEAAAAAVVPFNPWGDLWPEMLVKIAAKAGAAQTVQAMVSVCWYDVLSDVPSCLIPALRCTLWYANACSVSPRTDVVASSAAQPYYIQVFDSARTFLQDLLF